MPECINIPKINPDPITEKNIENISRMEKQSVLNRSAGERLADFITRMAGSTAFIIFHLIWFMVWVGLNVGMFSKIAPWDPFPYSFLTLIVSLEAIFLSLLVLMAQNKMNQDADKRAHLDLQINMLAEQESTATLQMLEKICQHLGVPYEAKDAQHLAKNTDVNKLAKTLDEKLTANH